MPQRDDGIKLIGAVWLIDGNGGSLERGAILVQGDSIKAVGPPEGATLEGFNCEHQTALPGLVDYHVHLIGKGDGRSGDDLATLPDEVLTLQAARNEKANLYSGVTTVARLRAKNRTTFVLREAIEMGITPGPRLVLSGRPVAVIGGHLSDFGIDATGQPSAASPSASLSKRVRTSLRSRPPAAAPRRSFVCALGSPSRGLRLSATSPTSSAGTPSPTARRLRAWPTLRRRGSTLLSARSTRNPTGPTGPGPRPPRVRPARASS